MIGHTLMLIRKVAWLHIVDRRLLCVRTTGRSAFYVPGGKTEAGEDDHAALIRELGEELSITIDRSTIASAGRFAAPADGKPGATVEIEAFTAGYSGTLAPGGEIAEHRFLTSAEPVPVSLASRAILDHLRSADVID